VSADGAAPFPGGSPAWPADTVARVASTSRAGVAECGLDGGGVSIVTPQGHRATVCASDAVAALIEERQFTLGEGPCVDAASSLSPVLVPDLLADAAVAERWPALVDAASEVGVRAIFALPVRIGAIALGAYDLYRREPGELLAPQLRAALLTSDALAHMLLDLTKHPDDLVDDPKTGAAYRFQVHGAAGMVMVQLQVPIETAVLHLRAAAYSAGRSVDSIAGDVIAGRLTFKHEEMS
jgi:hypothetical protein